MFGWIEAQVGTKIPLWVWLITGLDMAADVVTLMEEHHLSGPMNAAYQFGLRLFGVSLPSAIFAHKVLGDVRITPLIYHTIRTVYDNLRLIHRIYEPEFLESEESEKTENSEE